MKNYLNQVDVKNINIIEFFLYINTMEEYNVKYDTKKMKKYLDHYYLDDGSYSLLPDENYSTLYASVLGKELRNYWDKNQGFDLY